MQAGVLKAEAAAAAAGGGGCTSGLSQGSQLLQPLLVAARRRLEVERASEQLQRIVASSHALGDLPKLEAAILSARRTGGVHPDILRWVLFSLQGCRCIFSRRRCIFTQSSQCFKVQHLQAQSMLWLCFVDFWW